MEELSMRKLAIAAGILIAIVVVAVLALPYLVDVNSYRPRIQAELEKRTGRPVSLGQMELKVFPLRFHVENAVVFDDPSFHDSQPFAQAADLYVSAKLLPLLHGNVQVDSVELVRPRIELIKNEAGAWNFSTLGESSAAQAQTTVTPQKTENPKTTAKPTPDKTAAPSAGTNEGAQKSSSFSLADLKITDGTVAVTDQQKHQPRAVYDHIDAELQNLAAGKPFSVDVSAHLPGEGKETIRLAGDGGPLNSATPAATPFKGKLTLDEVSLAGAQKFINSAALAGTDLVASGTADVNSDAGKMSSTGDLRLTNVLVHGVAIGYPVTANYDIAADLNANTYEIHKGDLHLGETPLSITGSMNAAPTPAQIDMAVKTSNAPIADLAKLAAAFGVAFNPGMTVNGDLNADLTARGATSSPAMNGTLSAPELNITGKDLAQPVRVSDLALTLTPQLVQSKPFSATTGSTTAQVQFAMKDYTSPAATLDATLRAPNAQLGELLSLGKAYGAGALEGISGSGPASIDVHVQGPAKRPGEMTYSGNGQLSNATLTVPQLNKPIRVKNAVLAFSQNAVTISNAALGVGSTNATGQVTLRNFAGDAPQVQFALNADQFIVSEFQQMMVTTPPVKQASGFSMIPTAEAAVPAQPAPGLLQKLTGSGTVQVGRILYDQLDMSNARSPVTLDHGIIRMAPFTAGVYGGTETGDITMDTRPALTVYTVNTKLDHVDANQLLSSVSSLKKTIYGLLTTNAVGSFSSSGSDSNFAKGLNGNVSLNLQNGKLANVDLLNQLASIGKFLNVTRTAQPFTDLLKLSGDFKILNGIARTNNLQAAIEGGTLAANGAVNLADNTLNMAVTAVLSKEYAQKVGGTGIGGMMSTALANSNGELVIPVLVTGSFANPRIAPDLQRVAQMKMQQLLPNGKNPGALTTGILGSLLGGKAQGGAAGQNPSAQNPMQGILGALGPKQNPNQPGTGGTQQGAPQSDQTQGQQQQQQSANPIGDILNAIGGAKKKQPPPAQNPPQQPPK